MAEHVELGPRAAVADVHPPLDDLGGPHLREADLAQPAHGPLELIVRRRVGGDVPPRREGSQARRQDVPRFREIEDDAREVGLIPTVLGDISGTELYAVPPPGPPEVRPRVLEELRTPVVGEDSTRGPDRMREHHRERT